MEKIDIGKFIQTKIDKINTTIEVHIATILVFLLTVLSSPSIKLIKNAPKRGIKIINDKIGQLVITYTQSKNFKNCQLNKAIKPKNIVKA